MPTLILLSAVLIVTPGFAAAAPSANQIYATRCAFCHGANGAGDGPAGTALQPPPTNFARPDYWKDAPDARLRSVIVDGKAGTAMVPFGKTLTANEIDALLAYIKAFKPN